MEGELSVRYPLLVKEGGGRLVVCVAKELEDALPVLPRCRREALCAGDRAAL